jgi:hypothetical protein
VITYTQSHLKRCVYLQALDVVPPRPKGDARSFKSCPQGYYCVTDQQGMANSCTRNDPEQRDTPTAVAHIHLLLHMLAGPALNAAFYQWSNTHCPIVSRFTGSHFALSVIALDVGLSLRVPPVLAIPR